MMGTSLSSLLYAQENLSKDKPGTAVFVMSSQNTNKITITADVIEEGKEYLQINLKIPVINHLKNKTVQRKLNKKIRKNQLCLKATIEKDALRNFKYTTKKAYPVHPYELISNYNIKSNNEVFSLEISIYDYRGGAHGMTTNSYYTIDTKTCKILSLKDICNDNEKLNEEINKQIAERRKQGEMFFDGQEGFNGVKPDQSFYIREDGQLVIVFGLYEIAPYAAGIIEFPIPKEILNNCH